MTSICLCIIVKNESHCIKRCLDSVKPFIDYWIISDTGSTDNTEEIAKETLKDISGEYHHHEWFDFSTNRNFALDLARNKSDYIIIIDADDYLIVDDPNIFNNLIENIYSIDIVHGSTIYCRPQLINNKIQAKFCGVLHEYLQASSTPIKLEGCRIIFGADGARWSDPGKYKNDAETLEKALINNPNDSRYMFYLAQSYKDCGELKLAYENYIRRSKMAGWNEEVYISLLEAAKLAKLLNHSFDKIEILYIKAFNIQPKRVESLYNLCSLCRENGLYEKSYFYAKIGANICKPKPHEVLFLNTSCYDWGIKDELAISSFYIGKKNEAIIFNQELLDSKFLPNEQKDRIINNLLISKK